MLGIPIKLSETPGGVEKAPPKFGEHNREVLRAVGYSDDDIAGFEKEGVTTKGITGNLTNSQSANSQFSSDGN
jgi:hypothetical protein